MQWKSKIGPKVGDTRIKKNFLLLPKSIDGITKWLEIASWKQEYKTWYHLEYDPVIGSYEVPINRWTNIEWIK